MKRFLILLLLLVLQSNTVFALTEAQRKAITSGVYYFNTEEDSFSVSGSNSCATAELPAISDTAGVAAAIDQFIINHGGAGSPLEGMGSQIVQGAVAAGVNPFLIVAIALKESSFGTAGIATQGTYNAFGRTASDSQPHVDLGGGHLWYKWDSWEDSLTGDDNQAQFLRRVYIEGRGLTNIRDVIFTYAPPNENDTELYAQQIDSWIQELITASGSAISCGTSIGGGNAQERREMARQIMSTEYGWGETEFVCLDNIWNQESQWDIEANNPRSSAYGIPQAMMSVHKPNIDANFPGFYEREIQNTPGSTETYDYSGGDAEVQIRWGLDYIRGRYGTPCDAWDYKQRTGVY